MNTVTQLAIAADGYGYGCCELVNGAKRFIEEHYQQDVRRSEIARYVHVTPNYLSRLFSREVGMSLRSYINLYRIQDACRLLECTDAPISRIAVEVGFENISYFSTVFRKYRGMSPAEWREKISKESGAV